jgi:hypothetical protein
VGSNPTLSATTLGIPSPPGADPSATSPSTPPIRTRFVYTGLVSPANEGHTTKNITLSADEALIDAARERARSERTTLNDEFRRWLADYVRTSSRTDAAMAVVARMQRYVRTGGRRFTRDEMNER